MKTLLFTLEYPPQKGGVANYYDNLVRNWPDPDIGVLTLNPKKDPLESEEGISRKKLLSSILRPRWLPAFWYLFREVKKRGYSHILVGQILPLGTVAYYLNPILKTKYTVIIHGMDWTWALKKKRKREMARKILTRADKIICGNTYVASLVEKELGEGQAGKIKVVNPGISAIKLTENQKIKEKFQSYYNPENDVLLLTLARLVERKGVDRVLEVLPRVWQEKANIKYFVAGTGPEEEYLRQKREELGANKKKVIFLGEIREEEKWHLLQLCDIFIMPAREIRGDFEGFGIVYLEANSMAKPVIAGRSGGVGDAVRDGVNGLMVDPENKDQIRKAILKLAQDQKLRYNLGQKGKNRVEQEFSCPQKIQEIYYFLKH